MFGHYRNTGIPRLYDYGEAMYRFNSTKPIRGRTDISKPMYPLGHRSKVNSFWMMKCPLTQDVECYLWRTPVVTFKSNGEVHIKSDGWSSPSTANFISEVLGGTCAYIYDHSLCVSFFEREGEARSAYRVPDSGSLVIKRGEDKRWHYVSGAVTNVTHKVNRKVINGLRKQYKDFKQYAIAMIKLREGSFTREEFDEVFGGAQPNNFNYGWGFDAAAKTIANTKACMSDTSEDRHNSYYKALLSLVRSYGGYNSISLQAFESGFNQFTLGLHRDEALTEEVLPLGVVRKDNYGRYFRRAWGKYHEIKPEAFVLGESNAEQRAV